MVPHHRRYIPGTMVLETTWHTPTGWLIVQDLLVVEPVTEGVRRSDYRRAPGDTAATGTLLRLATCIGGRVEVVVNAVPVFEYGRADRSLDLRRRRLRLHDRSTRRPPASPRSPLTSSIGLGAVAARCYGRSTLEKGETAFARAVVDRPPADDGRGRRRHSSTTPSRTGGTGWPTAPSPTTPGAATWSAAP